MTDIRFRSDILVIENPEACCGSDTVTTRTARVVKPDVLVSGEPRTVGACLPLKHNSPFEHGMLSVYVEAPGVVWWQLTRQRFMSLDTEDFSFNLESGRYKVLEPEFYLPPDERPMFEDEGFKPMRPALVADASGAREVRAEMEAEFRSAWKRYSRLIGSNTAREVARLCLPNWALYCDGYVSAKPLTWLQFFSKRNRTADTSVPTFPQWEIEQFARQCEDLFAKRWPITHAAFVEFGRTAP